MKHLEDEQLVRLFLETQRNTYFEALYERYSTKVYRKCLSFTHDQAQAEDYTHDIFLKVVLNLNQFKDNARFSTWLYSITYNYCIDRVRSARKMAEEALDENMDVMDDSEDMELAEVDLQRLGKTLEKLPADERSLLLMKYQDELSIREIADAFGLTDSAVKMRLMRARDKFRKYYMETMIFWVLVVLDSWYRNR